MIYVSGNTTDSYKRIDCSGLSHITIFNDSIGNALSISLDGSTSIGVIYNEGIEFKDVNLDSIFIKSNAVGAPCPFRLWIYGKRNLIYSNSQPNHSGHNQWSSPVDLNYRGGKNTYGKGGL